MELIRRYRQGKLTIADIRALNYGIICLMIVIGIGSIVWSISLHMLSIDLYNMFIGAKLAFRERDFNRMDGRSKLILQDSIDQLNRTYNPVVSIQTKQDSSNDDGLTSNLFVMPAKDLASSTMKPKVRKIAHLFRIGINSQDDDLPTSDKVNDPEEALFDENSTATPLTAFDAEADYHFLANMVIDVHQTRWRESIAVQFIYGFPFWSEIVAIIWIGMCLIYQSGVKKYWGLPKPWRIVIPSIIVFTLMTLGSVTYTILAQRYLRSFCQQIRAPLTRPEMVTCGQAISVLRPVVRRHSLKHDLYLMLFHAFYLTNMVCWALALVVVVCRYIFAIDFSLVDVSPTFDEPPSVPHAQEYVEVLLSSPQHHMKVPRVEALHRSEDDFQSAKSHLSEVAVPLLDDQTPFTTSTST